VLTDTNRVTQDLNNPTANGAFHVRRKSHEASR
jgi:hypothetical protein